MLKRIDHVNIVVSDLDKTSEFFQAIGFKVEDKAKLSGEWISSIVGLENAEAEYVKLSLPGGEALLELIKYYNPPSDRDPKMNLSNQLGFRHIAFAVDDIDAVVAKLAELGVEPSGGIRSYPKTGKRLCYFYGPDEIILELAQY